MIRLTFDSPTFATATAVTFLRLGEPAGPLVGRGAPAPGNSTSLVGTPQQVAESLVEYYDLGVDIFLIRGFDPLIDAIEYGRELMPLTKKLIAEREKARGVAAE